MTKSDDGADETFDAGVALFSPGAANDPEPVYQHLREQCPVSAAAGMFGDNTWYLSRYEDIAWAMRHPEVFSSSAEAVKIGQEHPLIPLQVDPPDHAQFRRLLDPEFSPRRMAELEPEVRALTIELIEKFADADGCDFHTEFATPLPSTVFLRLLGLPLSDVHKFMQWRDDTVRPRGKTQEEQVERRHAAASAITRYLEDGLDAKRADPADDLLTRIVHGSVNGRPLTRDEQLGICHLQLIAGLDTVTATLDCMVAYLAQHPERRHALIANPELVDKAVEELLRTETPVQVVPRVLAQDFELRGEKMQKGEHVVFVIGAADTDPAEFEDAATVRFDRAANRHLAFGGGPHRCLGSHLARMELRVALDEFHRRIPDYELLPDSVINYSAGIRQADHLPLRFTRSS